MKKMSKPKNYNSNEIDEIFDSISPEEFEKAKQKMLLAMKIEQAMRECGFNKTQFAKKIGKNPSEITKWLSGTHNFTYDTLFDIQKVLKINIIDISDNPVEEQVIYHAFATSTASSLRQDSISEALKNIFFPKIRSKSCCDQFYVFNG